MDYILCKILYNIITKETVMDYNILMDKAIEASKNAYTKYSNFPVGACVLAKSGEIYCGCNFENSSFGLTICAERNAIGTAVANGEREIVAVAIYSPKMEKCFPCGACRQVLYEFRSPDGVDVILKNGDNIEIHKLDDLLPGGFDL